MDGSPSLLHGYAPALLRTAAIVAIAVGVGVWGVLLPAPVPRESPPMLDSIMPSGHDTSPVAQWFGGAQLRVRVAAAGVIAAGDGRGAALLSVDGGPVRAYRAGQVLAPGVVLDAVTAAAVSIDQDGVVEQVAVPASPAGRVQGFVPVPAAPD